MGRLKYDKDMLDFVEDKRSITNQILRILKFLGYTLSLVLIYYLIASLFFSTETEKKMLAESRLIEREYDVLLAQADLLESVVNELAQKDESIYLELFNAKFPDASFSDTTAAGYLPQSAGTEAIIFRTSRVLDRLDAEFNLCNNLIQDLTDSLVSYDKNKLKWIPSIMPIANFHLGNVGASMGRKVHPFYKQVVFHGGLDMVAPTGVEVLATANGRVKLVEHVGRQYGTRVIINHRNGYETVYAHLSDVLVREGQNVRRGDVIARTGNTGTSFAPHLHYEILKRGKQVDPLCYLNAELNTDRYIELLMYAVNNGQSLD